jgi:hypothetical protein
MQGRRASSEPWYDIGLMSQQPLCQQFQADTSDGQLSAQLCMRTAFHGGSSLRITGFLLARWIYQCRHRQAYHNIGVHTVACPSTRLHGHTGMLNGGVMLLPQLFETRLQPPAGEDVRLQYTCAAEGSTTGISLTLALKPAEAGGNAVPLQHVFTTESGVVLAFVNAPRAAECASTATPECQVYHSRHRVV